MVQSPPFVGRVSTCRLLDGLIDASGGGSASVVLGEPGVTVHEEGLRLGGCSALWRLRGAGIAVVTSDQGRLALRDDVLVDLDAVNDWAGRVIAGCAGPAELTFPEHAFEALNLLTGWYDDWIIMQRERVRQRLLHALEILSARLSAGGRHFEAVEVALSAVHADPLRETAQQALVAAHLANGNRAEARRAQGAYAELLRTELGLEPGDRFPAPDAARRPVTAPRQW